MEFVIDVIAGSDLRLKAEDLILRWKLTVNQQESRLYKSRPSCHLVDGVAAVFENAFLAVDIRDSRDAVHRV